jgi:hypothetical protein
MNSKHDLCGRLERSGHFALALIDSDTFTRLQLMSLTRCSVLFFIIRSAYILLAYILYERSAGAIGCRLLVL